MTPVFEPPVSPPLPPAPEDASELWELLYESLGFHGEDDEANDFALRKFCEALCAPMQPAYDLVRERSGQAGWTVALDPDNAPSFALPWLSQFVGVQLVPEMDDAQRRAEIKHPTSWKRGQPESIQIAARRTLKPVVDGEELFVIMRPRTPEVGRLYVRTLLSQTPEPDRTARVLRDSVPAWDVIDYAAIEGETFSDLTASKYTTFGAEKAALASYRHLTEALLGDL